MDPNKTLQTLLDLADDVLATEEKQTPEAITVAENIQALHQWLKNGGFLPRMWDNKKSKKGV